MVKRSQTLPVPKGRSGGFISLELIVAIALLAAVLFPLAFGFRIEQRLCKLHYTRSVVMEILDGEMEMLAAGEWKAFRPGTHAYAIRSAAVRSLPPGQFLLTVNQTHLRLQWIPAAAGNGSPLQREMPLNP
ncbi:MAG: hypothetical protein AB1813_12245 [Verrucomicrobiota bacterium]